MNLICGDLGTVPSILIALILVVVIFVVSYLIGKKSSYHWDYSKLKPKNNDYGDKTVFCQGCRQLVKRKDAEFVFWGSIPMSCHFCKDCLKLINEACKEGREVTSSELKENKLRKQNDNG